MIVREMKLEDLEKVYALELDCYHSPWTKDMFLSELTTNKFAYLFVLEYNDVIIGYYGFWAVDDQAMITKVTITKPLRGKGLSKVLMQDCLHRIELLDCTSITLEVRVSNQAAIHLYESYGFKKLGIRKKYYTDGEDAYAMGKRFDKGDDFDEETYISN